MTGSQQILTAAGVAAGILWALARTRRGEEVTADGLEEVMVTARRVGDAAGESLEEVMVTARRVATWLMPAAGRPYQALFDAATKKYDLPPDLLARQAYQESRFRADIVTGATRSRAGAVGIMQIIPKWHPELSPGDAAADEAAALDPARAIDYAGKLMQRLYRRFGTWSLALAAYNAGEGNVARFGGIPPFPETQSYVADITNDVRVA